MALTRCAEETGADIIAPLTCIGDPPHTIVHMAGGEIAFGEDKGRRTINSSHRFMDQPLDKVRDALVRQRCDFAEFHWMFVKTGTSKARRPARRAAQDDARACRLLPDRGRAGRHRLVRARECGHLLRPAAHRRVGHPLLRHALERRLERRLDDAFHGKWDCWFDWQHRRKMWIERHREVALAPIQKRWQPIVGYRLSQLIKSRTEYRIIRRALAARPKELNPPPAPQSEVAKAA